MTHSTLSSASPASSSPLACPSSTLSDSYNAFFLWVALLFAGIYFLPIAAGRSSSLALAEASFAALALVVGFRACKGGFFEVGLALGGGICE